MSIVAMALYRLFSRQRHLRSIKANAAAVRREIAAFDGEFDELTPLIRRSLALSLQQIGWILLPALLASVPLIACLVWVHSAYSFRALAAGEVIAVVVRPANEAVTAEPLGALTGSGDRRQLAWPKTDAAVQLLDRRGASIARLTNPPRSNVVEPFVWWNWFIGNPSGYIATGSPVESIAFELPVLEVLPGPRWLRGWETPFFLTLIAASLSIKAVFRIE